MQEVLECRRVVVVFMTSQLTYRLTEGRDERDHC